MNTTLPHGRRRLVRNLVMGLGLVALSGGAYGLYLFNMPHRDVQATATAERISAGQLAAEFLNDPATSNAKYLGAEGDGLVLEVSGTVRRMDTDLNGQRVLLLESEGAPAGVRCTFLAAAQQEAARLKPGEAATVKGVIRAGASYDTDLELYEHAVLDNCALVP